MWVRDHLAEVVKLFGSDCDDGLNTVKGSISVFPCFPSPILVAGGHLTLLKLVLKQTHVLVSVTGQISSP